MKKQIAIIPFLKNIAIPRIYSFTGYCFFFFIKIVDTLYFTGVKYNPKYCNAIVASPSYSIYITHP